MADAYKKAQKRGEQDARRAIAAGRHPYLTDLESLIGKESAGATEREGTIEIPLDMVVGTVSAGRQTAFSRTFMPLLEAESEFGIKWSRLYDIQVEEGYRDPIRVTEFMHRFYVQEGNKRVSVLKYLGARTVMAEVTRLYPAQWEGVERRLYGEFCAFWRVCPIYDIEFSREGSYRRLAACLGRDLEEPWPHDAVEYLRTSFLFFSSAYERAGGAHLDITPADALLVYLNVYTQDRLLDTPSSIVIERLGRLWRELMAEGMDGYDRVDLVEAPADDDSSPVSGVFNFFMGKTSYNEHRPLRVSFIHDYGAEDSGWVYAHELGRRHLENLFGGIVSTEAYENCADEMSFAEAVRASVESGAEVVFSTAPALMDFTVKAALAHPDMRFLNCSVGLPHPVVHSYYGKMYEAKFLLGALAASLAEGHRIGYRSYYPVFGTIAEINAFAVGASLVDPGARVALSWSRGDTRDLATVMREQHVQIMSGSDVVAPYAPADSYGLHRLEGDALVNIGAPEWHWGRYYELIVRSLLHGSWEEPRGEAGGRAVSYWYGMGAGVIDVRTARDLPYSSKKLVRLLRRCIIGGSIHPFEDELRSQEQLVQLPGFPALSSLDVVGMTWLADNVEGGFPDDWEIDGRALTDAGPVGRRMR